MIKWFIWKSVINSITMLWFNTQTGFSALEMFTGLLGQMYDVNSTNVAIFFYTLFDQDISFTYTNREDKLPFKLSHYYNYCRVSVVNRLFKYYIGWLCYSFLASGVTYLGV